MGSETPFWQGFSCRVLMLPFIRVSVHCYVTVWCCLHGPAKEVCALLAYALLFFLFIAGGGCEFSLQLPHRLCPVVVVRTSQRYWSLVWGVEVNNPRGALSSPSAGLEPSSVGLRAPNLSLASSRALSDSLNECASSGRKVMLVHVWYQPLAESGCLSGLTCFCQTGRRRSD